MEDWVLGQEFDSGLLFTLFYFLICACFVTQSGEFASAGLSPENLLAVVGWFRGTARPRSVEDDAVAAPAMPSVAFVSEERSFLEHHILRTSGTLLLHSLLPAIYVLGLGCFQTVLGGLCSPLAQSLAILPPLTVGVVLIKWSSAGWSDHPIAKEVAKFRPSRTDRWTHVARDINTEYQRTDKIIVRTNPTSKVVVTDNWIMMMGQYPWSFRITHQSDVELKVVDTDNHSLSRDGDVGGTQYLTIRVEEIHHRISVQKTPFSFRLNSLDYQNLQDKLRSPIRNVENVQIFKSVSERFVEVFREHVEGNPRVADIRTEEAENCIGCMTCPANVKLHRRCDSVDSSEGNDRCVTCYCRPMWCLTCLGKWFASRQDQSKPETWLGSRCPCPTCRSKFCILDVCLIDNGMPLAPEQGDHTD